MRHFSISRHVLVCGLGLAAALSLTTPALATSNCQGVGFIDSVFQNGLGGSNYEYFIQIRNQGNKPMQWTLTFTSFPTDVTLFSPSLTGGTLNAYESKTIKFGKGTNGNINTGTVKVAYDTPVAGKPSATLSKCVR